MLSSDRFFCAPSFFSKDTRYDWRRSLVAQAAARSKQTVRGRLEEQGEKPAGERQESRRAEECNTEQVAEAIGRSSREQSKEI